MSTMYFVLSTIIFVLIFLGLDSHVKNHGVPQIFIELVALSFCFQLH